MNEFRLNVDPTNPGQFFACCGLFELADRLYGDTQMSFSRSLDSARIRVRESVNGDGARSFNADEFLADLAGISVDNTMTDEQLGRLETLRNTPTKEISLIEKERKKQLESLWRDSPIVLGPPLSLRLDWFHDTRSGGSRFKTWAGQQSVIDIARKMKRPIDDGDYADVDAVDWLHHVHGHDLTFNFDSDASVQGAPIDVGFSLDPLKMTSSARPLVEFLAFVGLQRFRPKKVTGENVYTYSLWTEPIRIQTAAAVASGCVPPLSSQSFFFPLLYRTKYLKSFLPANPVGSNI